MVVKEILLLGNPRLYETSESVEEEELDTVKKVVNDLHDTLIDFRKKHKVGRAIAAPQINVKKRLVYMNINDKATVIINPRLENESKEMIEVWDDCMSFPDLQVKVLRHRRCHVFFRGLDWEETCLEVEDDLSELLQHEYDHLNGILAIQRAIDSKSIAYKSQQNLL
ncbi:MAG: peptide deformylase [Candidatus Hodarchaeales archaeon]|jgi:peptide deformylase